MEPNERTISGIVTALTVQKRNRNRLNVYLDGRFAFGLAGVLVTKIKVGQHLLPEDVNHLLGLDAFETGKQAAVRFIGYRPRSIAEVKRKLLDKGYEDPVIAKIIEKLVSIELLGDDKFARYWIEQRETFKPRSHFALHQELRQKGVSRELIEAALSDVDEEASARQAANKRIQRWATLSEDQFRLKLSRHLKQRGFGYEIINKITNEMWQTVTRDNASSSGRN